jgi:hypothetical protein
MKGIAVAYFLGSLSERPDDATEMQRLLGCSRTTAYRWLKFVREFDKFRRSDERRIAEAFSGWAHRA